MELVSLTTTDGKPKTFKVGDNVMYSDFGQVSIIKEDIELDEDPQ